MGASGQPVGFSELSEVSHRHYGIRLSLDFLGKDQQHALTTLSGA